MKPKLSTVWNRIGDLLQAKELWTLLFGGSAATVAARFAQSVQTGALVAVFGTLAAFAAGALLARGILWIFGRLRYVLNPPKTTLDTYGGLNWTIVVNHSGPPVKVRVRLQMAEVGNELDPHFEPFDVHLHTKAHGPSLQSIELTDEINFAKATIASMEALDDTAKRLDINLPGMGPKTCVVQRVDTIFLVMGVWLFVVTPFGVRKIYETHKAIAKLDGFHVQDRSGEQEKLDAAKS